MHTRVWYDFLIVVGFSDSDNLDIWDDFLRTWGKFMRASDVISDLLKPSCQNFEHLDIGNYCHETCWKSRLFDCNIDLIKRVWWKFFTITKISSQVVLIVTCSSANSWHLARDIKPPTLSDPKNRPSVSTSPEDVIELGHVQRYRYILSTIRRHRY